MEKPVTQTKEHYDIMEIFDYVQEKYNLDVIFMDFWHWFVNSYEPDNGIFIELDTNADERDNEEIKSIKEKLLIEFGTDIPLYVTY